MNRSFFSVQYSEKPPKNAEALEEENSRLGSMQLSLADTPVRPVPGCACRLKRKKIPRQRDWWDQLRQRWWKTCTTCQRKRSISSAGGWWRHRSKWLDSFMTIWNFMELFERKSGWAWQKRGACRGTSSVPSSQPEGKVQISIEVHSIIEKLHTFIADTSTHTTLECLFMLT